MIPPIKRFLALAVVLAAANVTAEPATSTVTTSGSSPFGASVDLRPSWTTGSGEVHSENEAALKWQISEPVEASYVQEFRTNLFNPDSAAEQGLQPALGDGYLKGDITGVWNYGRLSLSYEPRLYLPTNSVERSNGLIALTRQYLKFNYQVTDLVALQFMEVPILAVHSQAGYEKDGALEANRWFENRIEVGPKFTFFNTGIELKVPLIIQNLRHRPFDDTANNNDGWSHVAWVYPELIVPVAGKSTLGIGYYSDNLARSDFKALNLSEGFKKGTLQVIFQQSI